MDGPPYNVDQLFESEYLLSAFWRPANERNEIYHCLWRIAFLLREKWVGISRGLSFGEGDSEGCTI